MRCSCTSCPGLPAAHACVLLIMLRCPCICRGAGPGAAARRLLLPACRPCRWRTIRPRALLDSGPPGSPPPALPPPATAACVQLQQEQRGLKHEAEQARQQGKQCSDESRRYAAQLAEAQAQVCAAAAMRAAVPPLLGCLRPRLQAPAAGTPRVAGELGRGHAGLGAWTFWLVPRMLPPTPSLLARLLRRWTWPRAR